MSHTEGATGRLLKLKKLPDDFEEIYTIAGLMIGKANNSQDIVFFYPPTGEAWILQHLSSFDPLGFVDLTKHDDDYMFSASWYNGGGSLDEVIAEKFTKLLGEKT